MEEILYLVYSASSSGWLSNGMYTSDMKQATRMSRESAIQLCRIHKEKAGYAAIPVRLEDMEEVQ
jgi:hypothetical protein